LRLCVKNAAGGIQSTLSFDKLPDLLIEQIFNADTLFLSEFYLPQGGHLDRCNIFLFFPRNLSQESHRYLCLVCEIQFSILKFSQDVKLGIVNKIIRNKYPLTLHKPPLL